MKTFKASFPLFLVILFLSGATYTVAGSGTNTLGVSVELQEWLVLEVSTPREELTAQGSFNCSAAVRLDTGSTEVQIRALLSVKKNQEVQLRVQALGDLLSPEGGTIPISHVTWTSSGEGFHNGVLTNHVSQIMARWTGPGLYVGTIRYNLDAPEMSENFSQTVTYSLIMP